MAPPPTRFGWRTRLTNEPLTPAHCPALRPKGAPSLRLAGTGYRRCHRLPSLWTRCCRFQDSPLGQDSRLHEPPERDQQLAPESHNPEFAEPGTGRLETAPGPGDLNRHRAYMPIARFGDAQVAA